MKKRRTAGEIVDEALGRQKITKRQALAASGEILNERPMGMSFAKYKELLRKQTRALKHARQ